MNLRPLGTQCVVQLIPSETTTTLWTPGEPTLAGQATVTQCGPEVREVRVGETVVVTTGMGMDLGDGRLLVPESAILGKIA